MLNYAVTERMGRKHLYAIKGIATVADLFMYNELNALLFIMEQRRLGND
jgi:hypothetical protein